MKKILAILLALALVFSLAACGNKGTEPAETPDPVPSQTVEPTQAPEKTPEPTESPEPTDGPEETPEPTDEPIETPEPTDAPTETPEPTPTPTPTPTPEPTADPLANCVSLLTAAWDDHSEDEKFPVVGGDYGSMVDGAPGAAALDEAYLDSVLGLPASAMALIDSAASVVHMMNANTFTCGAYHTSGSENVAALAQALRDNIQSRQWMCGMPERVVVLSVGNYVISIFGHAGPVNTFVSHVSAVFPAAAVLYNEAITMGGGGGGIVMPGLG